MEGEHGTEVDKLVSVNQSGSVTAGHDCGDVEITFVGLFLSLRTVMGTLSLLIVVALEWV